MRKLARWSFRHRRIVVAAWIAAFVICFGISKAAGTAYSNNFTLPNTESTQALDLLQAAAPQQSGDTEQIVIGTSGGAKVTDPQVQQRMRGDAREGRASFRTSSASSLPYGREGAQQVSPDGSVAFAPWRSTARRRTCPIGYAKAFVDTAERRRRATAWWSRCRDSSPSRRTSRRSAARASGSSPRASSCSWCSARCSPWRCRWRPRSSPSARRSSVIGLVSHVMKMPEFSTELVLLIGLGVGVDYALFIVSRHRQGIQAGRDVESVGRARDRHVRAAPCCSRARSCASRCSACSRWGSASCTGSRSPRASACCSPWSRPSRCCRRCSASSGPRSCRRRQRERSLRDGPPIDVTTAGSGSAGRHGRAAPGRVRRRWRCSSSLLLAAPFLSLRLGSSDQGNDPTGTTTRKAYDLLAKGFGPGFNGPLQVVAETTDAAQTAALQRSRRPSPGPPGRRGGDAADHDPRRRTGTQVALFEVYPTVRAAGRGHHRPASTTCATTWSPPPWGARASRSTSAGITAIFADFATRAHREAAAVHRRRRAAVASCCWRWCSAASWSRSRRR